MYARFVFYFIGFGLILQALAQDVFGVSDGAALTSLRKLLADKGIETHAAGAKKVVFVNFPVV